jgi:soluble lytic murein transglycosylase-like protein
MRVMALGFSILIGVSGAQAQQPRVAAVDAAGRVLPLSEPAPAIDKVGVVRAAPCASAPPLSTDDARALVTRIAAQENFYPDFVLSVAKVESHFNSIALSDKGAVGLMQLMPDTAKRFNVDLCDPVGNVRGGVRYLRALHAKYRNPFYILAAYNAGEGAVDKTRGVPPFPETVRFVAEVIDDFYAWPISSGRQSEGPRDLSAGSPGPVEPSAAKAGGESHSAQARAPGEWSDGFVMHVD